MMKRNAILSAEIMLVCAWFTVWQREISFPIVSSIMTVVLALPAIIGCVRWLGGKKTFILLGLLSLFSYAIESLGLLTQFPYGEFLYSSNVGILLFDFLPLTLPFAWVPLLMGAIVLSWKHKHNMSKWWFYSMLWLVSLDAVLDPGAVFLGFWNYTGEGVWYDVPISNYFGWILSGSIGFFIAYSFIKKLPHPPQLLLISFWLSLVFWTGICLFGGLWGGALVGICLMVIISLKISSSRA